MTITDSPVHNGVNVQALLGAREALSAAPQAARFTWRASCTWRPDVRTGFQAVTVRFMIDTDASREELEALLAQSQKRSAVFDIVANPTKLLVELAR